MKLTLERIAELKSNKEFLQTIKDYYCYSDKIKDKDVDWLIANENRDKDIQQTAILTSLIRKLESKL